jgi:hypothetical protein
MRENDVGGEFKQSCIVSTDGKSQWNFPVQLINANKNVLNICTIVGYCVVYVFVTFLLPKWELKLQFTLQALS